ncbi:MAG: hypothetical protein ACRC7N_03550 [Clostridium sp.]
MKLLMLYVEKARKSKAFGIKASAVMATVFSGIGLAVNLSNGTNTKDSILVALILWAVWFCIWNLFTIQAIKVSAKIVERNRRLEEEEKKKEKEEKRRLAEERSIVKKNRKNK